MEETNISQTEPTSTTGVEPQEVVRPKASEMEGRNPDGTFKLGSVPNPNGRPRGSYGLTTLLKKKLQEIPIGQVKAYGDQIIEKLIELAIVKGDTKALKIILNYADGMPKQAISLEGGEGEPVKLSVETQGAVNDALSKFIGGVQKK